MTDPDRSPKAGDRSEEQQLAYPIPNQDPDIAPEGIGEDWSNRIRVAVENDATIKLFLNGALRSLLARGERYIGDVGVRAVDEAHKRAATAVDVLDVDAAAQFLSDSHSERRGAQWAVLGILAGANLSLLITVLAPSIPQETTWIVITLTLIALIACITWGIVLVRRPARKRNK